MGENAPTGNRARELSRKSKNKNSKSGTDETENQSTKTVDDTNQSFNPFLSLALLLGTLSLITYIAISQSNIVGIIPVVLTSGFIWINSSS